MKKIIMIAVVVALGISVSSKSYAKTKGANSLEAMKLFKSQQYVQAIDEYKLVLKNYPNDIDALKYIGLSYLMIGDSTNAALYLKKAKSKSPKNISVRYYLAQAYYESGQMDKAETEINYILSNLQGGIYSYKSGILLNKIRSAGDNKLSNKDETLARGGKDKPNPLKIYLRESYQFDSNVMLRPSKLPGFSRNQDSGRFATYTWLEYTWLNEEPWSSGVAGSFYQNLHTERALQPFNLSSFNFGPYVGFKVPVSNFILNNRVEYRYLYDILNGDSFTRAHNIQYRVSTDVTHWLNVGLFSQVSINDYFYRGSRSNKDFLNRDAVLTESGIRAKVRLPKDMSVYMGYEYSNNDAEGLNWNYDMNRIFSEFATPVITPQLYFYFLTEYYNRYFSPYNGSLYHRSSRFNGLNYSGTNRDEDNYSFRLKLRYSFNQNTSVETSFRNIINEASLERVFDYERSLFDVSFVYQF